VHNGVVYDNVEYDYPVLGHGHAPEQLAFLVSPGGYYPSPVLYSKLPRLSDVTMGLLGAGSCTSIVFLSWVFGSKCTQSLIVFSENCVTGPN